MTGDEMAERGTDRWQHENVWVEVNGIVRRWEPGDLAKDVIEVTVIEWPHIDITKPKLQPMIAWPI
jgi:hypothetical protein